jgi:TonB family protein
MGPGIQAPIYTKIVEPEYSDEAFYAKREGVVIISLVVHKDGTTSDLSVVRSLGFGLDERAIAAVKQWRFRPGYKDGKPVPTQAIVQVTFQLL